MRLIKPVLTILALGLVIYGVYHFLLLPLLIGNTKIVYMPDPDTLVVMDNGKLKRVQLIGADAPEPTGPKKSAQCYDRKALKRAAELFRTNRTVALEIDGKAGEKDGYGRDLRYVYLPDGTLYNGLLIKNGLAKESNPKNADYKYKAEFLKNQEEASAKGEGIWDKDECAGEF